RFVSMIGSTDSMPATSKGIPLPSAGSSGVQGIWRRCHHKPPHVIGIKVSYVLLLHYDTDASKSVDSAFHALGQAYLGRDIAPEPWRHANCYKPMIAPTYNTGFVARASNYFIQS